MSSHLPLLALVLACCAGAILCGVWSLYVPFLWGGLLLAGASVAAVCAATYGAAVLVEAGGWSGS